MSDDEHSGSEDESSPTEAEVAFKKRRGQTSAHGLDEAERELLETNKQDRIRMEQEIQELRKRNEKRKKEREVEEKRLAAERAAEDERRKAAEDAKKKQKEEEELKKQKERAKKLAEFEKLKNPDKPNFVISKRSDTGEEVVEVKEGAKKSREQIEAEKRAAMKQRITPLQIDGLEQSGLADKAKELYKLLYRLESEKYDLEKRFKLQQFDMMELAEKARQAHQVGRGGLKRAKLEEGESDLIQERYAGAPAKIQMFSKYERSKDQRGYQDKKNVFTGPQYILPPAKIKPEKIVKWSEEGLPRYEDIVEGGGHAE